VRIGLELRLLILLGAVCAFAVLGGLGYVVDESSQQVVITAIVGAIGVGAAIAVQSKGPAPPPGGGGGEDDGKPEVTRGGPSPGT
jgi:hypothetical protein